jgi:D-alanyl-D-alanine endopeptidase (penicillin-binding protein 7)
MKAPRAHEFDFKGFRFFLGMIVLFAVVGFSLQYGTHAVVGQVSAHQRNGATENTNLVEATSTNQQQIKNENQFLRTRRIQGRTLQSVVPGKGKYVGVDLVNMKLLLYQNGEIVQELPVLSKGKRASVWEAPSGIYEIKAKERDYFSSTEKVYMPYTLEFSGNFFIFGRPYDKSGTPVSVGYSSGSVVLSVSDAKTAYDFVNAGTGVFVYNPSPKKPAESQLKVNTKIALPSVSSEAYIVADTDTGQIYAEKNATRVLPIASVTKLMTTIVAHDLVNFDESVPVSGSGVWIPPDVLNKSAEKMTVGQLLYPLLLDSNNDVANSLARYYGTKLFLARMNEKAKSLGMNSTYYNDPSGLSAQNVSTVSDLFQLAEYVDHKEPFILDITRQDTHTVVSSSGKKYNFRNHTHFLNRNDYLGGKLGFTDQALETYVTFFQEPVGKEKHTLSIIVLHSEDRKSDTLALLNWFKKAVMPIQS